MIRSFSILGALLLPACQVSENHNTLPANTLPGPKESPNIFKTYSSKENAQLADGWAASFDMSGVSFDSRQTATLVTPRHVVMADHFKRKPGAEVIFHDREGRRLVRTLTAVNKVRGDVAVGLLNEDVPPGHRIYPLPRPDTQSQDLVGRLAAVTDQHRRIFFHRIRAISDASIGFTFDPSEQHGWSKSLVAGDSGNPTFLISGNQLILLETHTTGGPGAGPYYGSSALQEALQQQINALSPGYQLRYRTP